MAACLHTYLHETRFRSFAIPTPGCTFHRNVWSILPIRFVDDGFFGRRDSGRLGVDVCSWIDDRNQVAEAIAVRASRDADQEQFFCR